MLVWKQEKLVAMGGLFPEFTPGQIISIIEGM
jgi:hypothetical protein